MARAAETDWPRTVKREKTSDGDAARLKAMKQERVSKNNAGNEKGGGEEEAERVRAVKRERVSRNAGDREEPRRKRRDGEESEVEGEDEQAGGGDVDPRELRSMYMAVKNQINDEIDDLSKADSDKFHAMFREVQNLHQHVRKPREQVADVEALWGICSTLVSSVKTHSTGGITPKGFHLRSDWNIRHPKSGSGGESSSFIRLERCRLCCFGSLQNMYGLLYDA